MPEILSLALRPRGLSHLWGQQTVVKSIRKQMETRPPKAWLFSGASGCGKTTLARIMAIAYQCSHAQMWGDPCPACWALRSNFAIHEINASEISGVEELEKVASLSRYHPINGAKRVIILDEAQLVSNASQNMLLKPTEEPPAFTAWIICTTAPNKLIPTLRKRFTAYALKGLDIETSEKFLRWAAGAGKITKPLEPLFDAVHTAQITSPRDLLIALEKYAAGSSPEESASATEGAGANVNTLDICKAVTSGQWKQLQTLMADVTPDEARWVQSSVSGWLVGVLKRCTDLRQAERAAASIADLCGMAPLEDTRLLHWLWATLFRVCRRYSQ